MNEPSEARAGAWYALSHMPLRPRLGVDRPSPIGGVCYMLELIAAALELDGVPAPDPKAIAKSVRECIARLDNVLKS